MKIKSVNLNWIYFKHKCAILSNRIYEIFSGKTYNQCHPNRFNTLKKSNKKLGIIGQSLTRVQRTLR